jgi:RHS repeat-associated protein
MTATNEYGSLEERYEYDAFGKPYAGDLTSGMNLGYTGKPYDTATGLYNYGYRDYKPEAARFTTVDPIRDGSNWFAYVNNDPVNWIDLWGLKPTYGTTNDTIDPPEVNYGWPTSEGRITSAFGPRELNIEPSMHPGIDIAPVIPGTEGQDIVAAESGTVIVMGISSGGSSQIFIEHVNGEISVYKHIKNDTVKVGNAVTKGQKIAELGSGGTVNPHLHFEVRPPGSTNQTQAIDPILLLPERPDSITLGPGVIEQNRTLVNVCSD